MVFYHSRYSRFSSRASPWYSRGRYYSGARYARTRTGRRRANGEARAARAQRDSATVVISRLTTVSVPVLAGSTGGTAFVQHWDSLRQSEYFNNYAPMYDQIKLDKIRVKLNGTNAGATTDSVSPTVVIAFDRNGLDSSQLSAAGDSLTTGVEGISTYSSAKTKQWSTGNSFAMYQTIYPSTIMEKGQYIPTVSLTTTSSTSNPAYPVTDPMMPFKPITLIGIATNGNTSLADATYIFSAEIEYTVTFRGMRKPTLGYSGDDAVLVPLSSTVTSNGTYSYQPSNYEADGFNDVNFIVSVPSTGANLVPFSDTVTSNGTYNALPPAGYDGFSSVSVTVNVPDSEQIDRDIYQLGIYSLSANQEDNDIVRLMNVPITDFVLQYESGTQTHTAGQAMFYFRSSSGGELVNLIYRRYVSDSSGTYPGQIYYCNITLPEIASDRAYYFSIDRDDKEDPLQYNLLSGGSNTIRLDKEDLPSDWVWL